MTPQSRLAEQNERRTQGKPPKSLSPPLSHNALDLASMLVLRTAWDGDVPRFPSGLLICLIKRLVMSANFCLRNLQVIGVGVRMHKLGPGLSVIPGCLAERLLDLMASHVSNTRRWSDSLLARVRTTQLRGTTTKCSSRANLLSSVDHLFTALFPARSCVHFSFPLPYMLCTAARPRSEACYPTSQLL
ncbi:hypothetical protein BC834DRAFT_388963 [Gloeopeniophorella convolvens]|nr:hypothetical protein BC834DRAFT_388963 [Gloeopeniophorella convolvens]